jgi:hypothetical protein
VGGLYYGLAGLGHVLREERNVNETVAMFSDGFALLVLPAIAAVAQDVKELSVGRVILELRFWGMRAHETSSIMEQECGSRPASPAAVSGVVRRFVA